MKAFVSSLLILAAVAGAALAGVPDKDIVIVYTNDVHCGVDEHIGYAGLAFYRDEMRKRTPYLTLVDAGDAVQDVTVGGKPLDPGRMYSVIGTSYVLRETGDGHRFNGALLTKSDFITVADAIARYIKSLGTIPEKYREPQGRLKIIAASRGVSLL